LYRQDVVLSVALYAVALSTGAQALPFHVCV
jgi:hypothetical protein